MAPAVNEDQVAGNGREEIGPAGWYFKIADPNFLRQNLWIFQALPMLTRERKPFRATGSTPCPIASLALVGHQALSLFFE